MVEQVYQEEVQGWPKAKLIFSLAEKYFWRLLEQLLIDFYSGWKAKRRREDLPCCVVPGQFTGYPLPNLFQQGSFGWAGWMASVLHLAKDPHNQKEQGLSGVRRHPIGRKRMVWPKADWHVPLPPNLLGSHQLLAVLLVAGLPVLHLPQNWTMWSLYALHFLTLTWQSLPQYLTTLHRSHFCRVEGSGWTQL